MSLNSSYLEKIISDEIPKKSMYIFVIYSMVYCFFISIIQSFKIQLIILSISVLLSLIYYIKHKVKFRIISINLAWVLFLSVFLFRLDKLSINYLADFLFYSLCVLLMILFNHKMKNKSDVIKIIKGFAMFFTIGVLFQAFATDLYLKTVYQIFNTSGKASVMYLLTKGYYSGFTHQTAHTAGYLLVGIGATLFSLNWSDKRQAKIDIFQLVIMVFALILTGKRAHFIFMLMAIFSVMFMNAVFSKNFKKFMLILAGAVTVSVLLLVITDLLGVSNLLDRMLLTITRFRNGQDISSGRTKLYKAAWEQFKEHPVFGIGWFQFQKTNMGILIDNVGSNVHNIYLQLLLETGIVGFLLFIIASIFTLVRTIQYYLVVMKENIIENKTFVQFSFFYQIFFLLYGFTGNGLNDKNFTSMYFIAIALYAIAYSSEEPTIIREAKFVDIVK